MSWTAPRTWVAGEVVTAAIMNTHIRDEFQYLGLGDGIATSPPASPARYQRWIYQLSGGEHWAFVYRDDLDGTDPWHYIGGPPLQASVSTNPGTATVTVPRAGKYRVVFGGYASVSSGGDPSIVFKVGGSTVVGGQGTGNQAYNEGVYDTGHIAASTQIQMTTGGTNSPSGWGSVGVWPVKVG